MKMDCPEGFTGSEKALEAKAIAFVLMYNNKCGF